VGESRHTVRARRDLIDLWLLVREADPAAADARVLVESPYLILYRLIPEGVQIVRVLHGARRIGRVMFLAGLE
jgi:plasmid stabilization system protein ParE